MEMPSTLTSQQQLESQSKIPRSNNPTYAEYGGEDDGSASVLSAGQGYGGSVWGWACVKTW